ncbi:hypothetical protein [Nocardia sp. NBC_01388]|uniref:hypothetical protein n=1 Tax=Nocardia sp. NBC_01388 TaxID=2903596 RepID=UPI003246CFFB
MSEYISPVPMPALDAVAPEPYRGYHGMPMFVIVPTADLAASLDFWTRGLGFIDIFTVPDRNFRGPSCTPCHPAHIGGLIRELPDAHRGMGCFP